MWSARQIVQCVCGKPDGSRPVLAAIKMKRIGSLNREILRLALPNLITNITVPLLGMADLAMMGHLEDVAYLGAIALGSTIFSVLYSVFGFLRMGTTGLSAQAFGADNQEAIALVLKRSLLVSLALALGLIVLQYPIRFFSFYLLESTPQVEDLAASYFQIRIFAAPATLGLYALYGWFLGMQNAKIPMFIAVMVNVLNIGLNFLFVFGFHLSSDGVAWATLIAQYAGLFTGLLFLWTRYRRFVYSQPWRDILNSREVRRFMGINTDIFIRSVVLLLTLSFFTAMSAQLGETVLAVNTLLFQFFFLFSYFADGLAYAAESLVGKAYGSLDKLLLRRTIKRIFQWSFAVMVLASAIYYLGTEGLLRIMTDNEPLIESAKKFHYWIVLLPITSVAAFIWDGVYVGTTKTKPMRNAMLIASLVVFFPVFYLSRACFPEHALWFALNMFMLARSLLMWGFWNKQQVCAR